MTSAFPRRAVAVAAAALLVVFVFVSTSRDSAHEDIVDAQGRPRLGTAFRFGATVYCKGETTAAGTGVRTGMAAADPALLPLGSVIRVETQDDRYSGIWTVMDTGPEVAAARSTSTCGAATRRWPSAGAMSGSRFSASDGIRSRAPRPRRSDCSAAANKKVRCHRHPTARRSRSAGGRAGAPAPSSEPSMPQPPSGTPPS